MRDGFFRVEATIISRGNGQSVVAAAAYRTGLPLHDERTGTWHAFPHRGRIDHRDILTPEGAPEWAADFGKLANAIERAERRRDAQLAREFVISLPHELTFEQGLTAIRQFVTNAFVTAGYVVQLTSHGFKQDPETGRRNWHVHVWVTLRRLIAGQWERVKDRSKNNWEQLDLWRQEIADRVNEQLWAAGHDVQVHALGARWRDQPAKERVHKPYGIWKRAEAAAQGARATALAEAMAQLVKPTPKESPSPPMLSPPMLSPPMTLSAPANDRQAERPTSMLSRLADTITGAARRIAEAGRERSLAAIARIEARIAAEEEKKEKARQAEAMRKQHEAEWQQRDAEQRARRAHEELLVRLRDEMIEKAGISGPRAAFARAWKAEADRAILIDGHTIETYGVAANKAAMRALVEAGGDSNDAGFMAKLSPTARLIDDELARLRHIGGIVARGTADPEVKQLFDATNLERARAARFEHLVPTRSRPRIVEQAAAPPMSQQGMRIDRQRGAVRERVPED